MRVAASLAVLGLALGGCSVEAHGEIHATTAARAEADRGAASESGLHFELRSAPRAAEGVTVVEQTCAASGDDSCNGLDDDCNGIIDDDCGYGSGPIQVTLTWSTGADLDLYVTDPLGETISNGHPEAGSGGRLDRDGRGNCRPEPGPNVENVHWAAAGPPAGTYRVEVHYWGECNSQAGPTVATVSLSVGGRVRGVYRVMVSPNARVPVASFQIP